MGLRNNIYAVIAILFVAGVVVSAYWFSDVRWLAGGFAVALTVWILFRKTFLKYIDEVVS